MGYRKIDRNLVHIDELSENCGLFTTKSNGNNGYGCRSKSKTKQEHGNCFAFDCPLAYVAETDDFLELDGEGGPLYNQYKNEQNNYWMVQFMEVAK